MTGPDGRDDAEVARVTRRPTVSDGARQSVIESLAIDAHTAAVVTALHAAGIPSVLLKGPSIARWLYTDGTPRAYGDTDLLVPDDRIADVERVFTSIGLVPSGMPRIDLGVRAHASDWARPDGTGRVDLHWTIPDVGAPDRAWEVVSRDAEVLVVGGAEVRVGSEAFRTLNVVLHALHHGPEKSKPVEDMQRAIEQLPEETWRAAVAVAEELDAVAALGLGLGFTPAGAALAARLDIGVERATREQQLLAMGTPKVAVSLETLLAEPTWRGRARMLKALAFPSAEHLRAWDPKAAAGHGTVVGAYWRRLRRGAGDLPATARGMWRARRRPPAR